VPEGSSERREELLLIQPVVVNAMIYAPWSGHLSITGILTKNIHADHTSLWQFDAMIRVQPFCQLPDLRISRHYRATFLWLQLPRPVLNAGTTVTSKPQSRAARSPKG
jgi:hypothetical protein